MPGLLSEHTIEEIKQRTSLVGLIGEYVSLKKAGTSHKGLCPFHNEKTPSFQVDDGRGYYYCFGCQASGDAIKFLQEHVGYSFMEAVEVLAEKANITLPKETERTQNRAQRRQNRESRDRYYLINRSALTWFSSQLSDKPLAYLEKDRRLTPETISTYQLGYAPEGWEGLAQAVATDWQSRRDAESLGLIMQRREEGRGHYDRFRDRIIFPVFALGGEVIGFQGRTLSSDKKVPKYVNSSESTIFVKGNVLYGLYQARNSIRTAERAIIVEGNVDVLSLAQSGYPETVAPMGTALTQEQCALLRRFTNTVVLIYDGDSAGRAASLKSIPLLLQAGMSGRVVNLPDNEDPDTYITQQGKAQLDTMIDQAPHLFDYVVALAMQDFDGSSASRDRIIEAIAPAYLALKSDASADGYLKQLSSRFAVSSEKMAQWLRAAAPTSVQPRLNQSNDHKQKPVPPTQSKPSRLEKDLMALIIRHPRFLPFWCARSDEWKRLHDQNLLTHEGVRLVLEGALKCFRADVEEIDVGKLMILLKEQGRDSAGTAIAMILKATDPYGEEAEKAFVELVTALEEKARRQQKNRDRATLDSLSDEEQIVALNQWDQTA